MVDYIDSVYKFTDPIRYFKENDPYYWEIDNIPLKQLQENVLWLKDQLQLIPEEEDFTGVTRSDINELKPYVDDTGTLVKVKPGRFIARINDAYNKTPLQKLSLLSGGDGTNDLSEYNTKFGVDDATTDFADFVLGRIKSSVAASALSLNGLIDRVVSWDPLYYVLDTSNIQFLNGHPGAQGTWPHEELGYSLRRFIGTVQRNSQELANEFVKQFRGLARTAVVDVSDTLSLEVPPFNDADYFYIDQNGTKQLISGATLRFDLLFVYSKPIDTSSTTINKWNSNNPTTLLSPQLGLIKGAGVGVAQLTTNGSINQYRQPKDAVGNNQILAHVADQNITTNGFQGINLHGSFPSPDDLMNLAPVIQEKFESNDPRLIGQTILPLAYIVVRKDAAVGVGGVPILTSSDIIDIRPFLRTAELTYNERAGICAAVPSISLANPIATKYNVEKSIYDLKTFVDDTYERKGTLTQTPKIAAIGFVYGGSVFGPEQYLGFGPTNPLTTGWDRSIRATQGLNDFGALEHVDIGEINTGNYRSRIVNSRNRGRFGIPLIWRKRITITNINESFEDFTVNAAFHNCFPITGDGIHAAGTDEDISDSKYSGIYVLKGNKTQDTLTFTVVVVGSLTWSSWLAGSYTGNGTTDPPITEFPELQAGTEDHHLFFTLNLSTATNLVTTTGKITPFQSCFYPSIKYEVLLTPRAESTYSDDEGQSVIQSLV